MKLFMIHVGFYDPEISDGVCEFHTNYFIVAEDAKAAKSKVMAESVFQNKKMHIDGIRELTIVDGYRIGLEKVNAEDSQNEVYGYSAAKAL